MLKPHRIRTFCRLLSTALVFLKRLTIVLAKAILLMITGLRRLRIETLFVNQAFLLSNGLVILHWRVKNALWISIQGEWTSSRQERLLIYPAVGKPSLSIHIQGLFSSYKQTFLLCPLATLRVPHPSAITVPVPELFDKLIPLSTLNLDSADPICGNGLAISVYSIDVKIPQFQTEKDEDERLLYYS